MEIWDKVIKRRSKMPTDRGRQRKNRKRETDF